MANYECLARSNYFRVNDAAAFAAYCDRFDFEKIERTTDGVTLYGFYAGENGLPVSIYDEDAGEDVDCSWLQELAALLADGAVAIVHEIGYEKLRYLTGYACAFNNKGDIREISLGDMMPIAESMGTDVTPCHY